MKPLKKVTSVVVPLDRANVDTDAIVPKEFLTIIERDGLGDILFYNWRYDDSGKLNQNFILNRAHYQDASILLTRKNFGSGSSREHAPWALSDFGFKVLLAPSFADIFYNNCFKNGILPITLPEKIIDYFFERIDKVGQYRLTVDLKLNKIYDESGLEISYEIIPHRKEMLLNGLDDIGYTMQYTECIDNFEQTHSIFYEKQKY
ncbi:3-isopropylmalate dehydratase small subunit [Alkalihalobacterium alkalinitrilicum]|uniref:3-isopropylmalate dehydratase small subunit n=1 Tax=Alkalihalobacterium alkalinitrilicum TaxID=427920 RepID=UPI000995CD90|nr:3-isopropylmalate dehydratase small subunit [Alkalihalobacterium alkalinitrilicum]